VSWVAVCRRDEIPHGRGWPVHVAGRNIAVFDLGSHLAAVDNVCLHVGNPIDDGFVSGGCVTCPWHGWRYDLRTGEHLTMFGRHPGLRTYGVREEEGQVLVEVEE
jgi:nitrite reductase (NADH) small subunit